MCYLVFLAIEMLDNITKFGKPKSARSTSLRYLMVFTFDDKMKNTVAIVLDLKICYPLSESYAMRDSHLIM